MVVQILRRHGSEKFAQASTAASPGATTAIKPTDVSANEHVGGQRRSHFMSKFERGANLVCAIGELR
jgi:hypothetical protein